jgi:hypothetical protein
MDKLRAEAKAKLDAIFGPTPSPADEEDEEDEEDGEAFPVAEDPEKFAQAPANQAPDQTVDGYSADNFGLEE